MSVDTFIAMKCITLISKFALHDNHTTLDDERYFDFLFCSGANFRLYTSRFSVNRILCKYPKGDSFLRTIEDSPIEIEYGGRVVFLGFSESDVLAFLAINLLRSPRLVLIATNNFSVGRVKRLRWYLKFFLHLVRPFLDRLVLHTVFEQQLVANLDRRVAAKSFIKKHHLMTPHNHLIKAAGENPVISYYGPQKHDKPIEPFIDLVQTDTKRKFNYCIYGIKLTALVDRFPDLADRTNVKVIEDWQSHESYLKSVNRSTFVFLTHSHVFEGKLSGNFCDCLALRVPYIAQSMEPMNSYHAQYGPMGYLFDFEDSNWALRFLENYSDEAYENMHRNIERLGEDYSSKAINTDLLTCLIK